MKNNYKIIISILKIIIPSCIVFAATYLLQGGKDILNAIFFIFPLIFILIGIVCSKIKFELILSLTITSFSFIIPIEIFYNMAGNFQTLIIYNILAIISYFIKIKVKNLKLSNKKVD